MILVVLAQMIVENFPARLRRHFTMALLSVVSMPMQVLFDDFYAFFALKKYELQFDGVVVYLERALNEMFIEGFDPATNPADHQIYIVDSLNSQNVVLYDIEENNENTVIYDIPDGDGLLLWDIDEYYNDFIVMVPSSLVYNEQQMISLIRKYKISGKNFTIQTY